MRARARTIAVIVLGGLLAAGCSSAPVQEMSDARQAIMAASEAGADDAARAELDEAREFLDRAERKLQQREYRAARRAAVEAQRLAGVALRSTRD